MQSFSDYIAKVWLSALPRQLAYAICTAAVFEILAWIAGRRIRAILRPALGATRHPDPVVRALRTRMLLRPPLALSRAVLYILAIAIILRILGLRLGGEVLPILGVVFAAVAVACWPLLQDATRGYMLLLNDVWVLGDTVEVAGVTGVVEACGLLHTRIRTPDGRLVTVANGRATQVINHSAPAKGSQDAGPG
jgi:small conductance mechanosensitive channel